MDQLIRDHWQSIVTVIVLIGVAALVVRVLRPPKKVFAEDMTLNMRCSACGWQGTVTRYNQVCRKCNSRDLKQF